MKLDEIRRRLQRGMDLQQMESMQYEADIKVVSLVDQKLALEDCLGLMGWENPKVVILPPFGASGLLSWEVEYDSVLGGRKKISLPAVRIAGESIVEYNIKRGDGL
jgi:hypothetical protein